MCFNASGQHRLWTVAKMFLYATNKKKFNVKIIIIILQCMHIMIVASSSIHMKNSTNIFIHEYLLEITNFFYFHFIIEVSLVGEWKCFQHIHSIFLIYVCFNFIFMQYISKCAFNIFFISHPRTKWICNWKLIFAYTPTTELSIIGKCFYASGTTRLECKNCLHTICLLQIFSYENFYFGLFNHFSNACWHN